MKTLRLFVNDAPVRRRRVLADTMLSAIEPGKAFCAGTVWQGALKPMIDGRVAALGSIFSGFTTGNVLHAENVRATLDLGRRWLGDLVTELTAAPTSAVEGRDAVDLAPVYAGVRNLQEAIEANAANPAAIQDAVAGLKRAADAVRPRGTRDWLRPAGDQGREMNQRNADFWREREAAVELSTVPSATVRDDVARANRATNMRDRIGAINEANRKFWSGR